LARSGPESFSAPTAIAFAAIWKAAGPDAQAFSVSTIGLPSRPVSRSATWPRIISWPASAPSAALAKQTKSTSSGVAPASSSAPATASPASERTLDRGNLPNGVMNAPVTNTSEMSLLPSTDG
jgi:hypothetical protein